MLRLFSQLPVACDASPCPRVCGWRTERRGVLAADFLQKQPGHARAAGMNNRSRRFPCDTRSRVGSVRCDLLAGAARTRCIRKASEGVPSLYSSIIAISCSTGRSFLSAAGTDAGAMAEAQAAHYFRFDLGTEIAKQSRHSDRRRRSLAARGSDEPYTVARL